MLVKEMLSGASQYVLVRFRGDLSYFLKIADAMADADRRFPAHPHEAPTCTEGVGALTGE